MKLRTVAHPEVVAIVDLDYAADFEHWIGTVGRLSDLPDDPTLCVQIRAKSTHAQQLREVANKAREAFQSQAVMLSLNGDPSIAASCGYDACHQPQSNISDLPNDASHLIHSASIHDEASLQRAQSCDVDFVVFGPIYQPHWKTVTAKGLNELARLSSLASVPVLAIGGVNPATIPSISRAGAHGIASLSTVMDALDPVDAVAELQSKWRNSSGSEGDKNSPM